VAKESERAYFAISYRLTETYWHTVGTTPQFTHKEYTRAPVPAAVALEQGLAAPRTNGNGLEEIRGTLNGETIAEGAEC